MRKQFKLIAIYAASLLVFGLGLLFLVLALLISNSCDDAAGETARNSRGDVVKERLTICTGIGTVINHSVILLPLKPSFVWKTFTLAEYDPVTDSSPVFQWIDNDRLTIELGKVPSVWSRVDKVGSIHITYTYTKGE
ncbi:MAG: hypothetical protein ACREDT_06215 [Methylocella sp.]